MNPELPVSDWKRDELRRRKQRFLEDPGSARTWEQVKEHARERLRHGKRAD